MAQWATIAITGLRRRRPGELSNGPIRMCGLAIASMSRTEFTLSGPNGCRFTAEKPIGPMDTSFTARSANGPPRFTGAPNSNVLINVLSSFLIFDGFELDGGGVKEYAFSSDPSVDPHSAGHAEKDPGTAGGSVGHHIGVFNMHIHDVGGGGVSLNSNDYFTIWNNVVHDTSRTSAYQESGISVWQPHAIYDYKPEGPYDDEKFHIKILNNIAYHNYISEAVKEDHTDGNGIILDAWKHDQSPPFDVYPYEGLVQGNLAYGNGGRGIQVVYSRNVTVANNTAFGNNWDRLSSLYPRGEINVFLSDNVLVINNLMAATPDLSHPQLKYNTGGFQGSMKKNNENVVWKNNLTFNTITNETPFNADEPMGTRKIIAEFQASNPLNGVDPKIMPSDVSGARIGAPLPGSPALGAGADTPGYPPVSLSGAKQPSPPNIGAW